MGVVRNASVGAVACVGIAVGCRASAFACTDDAQCAGTDTIGFCEDSGYCSFDDDACPSRRRYGTNAPSDLAGECVAPSDATSVADDGGSAGDETSAGTTSASGTSLSTTPVDPSDATGDEATSAASDVPPGTSSSGPLDDDTSSTTDTGSTTGPPPSCVPVFVDDFEDGVLDPEWETWNSVECSFAEVGGHFEMTTGASAVEWVSAGLYTQLHPFIGGQVRVELVPFEPPLDVVGVWLTIFAGDCEVQIAAESSLVVGMSAGVWFEGVPVDTAAPLWLQLRVDDDELIHWEWSTDGEEWTEVHSEAAPCDFSNAQSALFAGGMHDQLNPIVRAVESYERCEP